MMRSAYLNVLFFVTIQFTTGHAQLQWTWQNPLPQGNTLKDLCIIDENTAVAVGYCGTIIKTTDGGFHWEIMNSGTIQRMYAVQFVNGLWQRIVWICMRRMGHAAEDHRWWYKLDLS